jgi:sulfur carrier protein ThiS
MINWFSKKKQEKLSLSDIPRFGLIVSSTQSKMNGVLDEHNKNIIIFNNGKIVEKMDYDEEIVKSLIEVDEIPVVHEIEDDEFKFFSEGDFGRVIYRR